MGLLNDLAGSGMFGVLGLMTKKKKKKPGTKGDTEAAASGPMASGTTVGIAPVINGQDFAGGFKAKAQAIEEDRARTKPY